MSSVAELFLTFRSTSLSSNTSRLWLGKDGLPLVSRLARGLLPFPLLWLGSFQRRCSLGVPIQRFSTLWTAKDTQSCVNVLKI
jgi:hypothetical protein